MEHVCNDLDGKSPWHYDAKRKAYFRCYDNEKHQGKILGEHLPNPDLLWKFRLDVVRKLKGSVDDNDRQRTKPSATTYALFNHWQSALQKDSQNKIVGIIDDAKDAV